MYKETITIDIDRLRDDMRDECLGAYFGGGFGAALIESFDVDERDKVYPIKIEVKTTASKADTEFFVTKNELEVSKEYKKSYFIYRVYDAKGLFPKFYRVA